MDDESPFPRGQRAPVFPLALGCTGMSGFYGPADPDEALATILEALDRGVNLLDTGDFYGMGRNELLVGQALRGRRDQAIVSVKSGALRGPDGSWLGVDGRPAAVKNFGAMSLARLGIGVTAYGVLSRGLLAGSTPTGPRDFRAWLPRFQGDNLSANQALVQTLRTLADEKGATASQLAIAWVLSRGPRIVPLIGARTRAQVHDSLGALDLRLSAEDLALLEAAVPATAVAGTRYDAGHVRSLDSERA